MQQERVADDGTKQQERAMEEAGRRQKKSYGGEQASGAWQRHSATIIKK